MPAILAQPGSAAGCRARDPRGVGPGARDRSSRNRRRSVPAVEAWIGSPRLGRRRIAEQEVQRPVVCVGVARGRCHSTRSGAARSFAGCERASVPGRADPAPRSETSRPDQPAPCGPAQSAAATASDRARGTHRSRRRHDVRALHGWQYSSRRRIVDSACLSRSSTTRYGIPGRGVPQHVDAAAGRSDPLFDDVRAVQEAVLACGVVRRAAVCRATRAPCTRVMQHTADAIETRAGERRIAADDHVLRQAPGTPRRVGGAHAHRAVADDDGLTLAAGEELQHSAAAQRAATAARIMPPP